MTGVFGACGVVGDLVAVVVGEGLEAPFVPVASREVEIESGRGFTTLPIIAAILLGCCVCAALPYPGLFPRCTFEAAFTGSGFFGGVGDVDGCSSAGDGSNAEPLSSDPRFSASGGVAASSVVIFSASGFGGSAAAV